MGTTGIVVVQWATNAETRFVEHMCVNHCDGDIFVAQKLLNGANVVARFEQMCSETVAEGISAWQAGQAAARGRGDDQEVRRARCDASKWTARREGNSRGLEAVEGCWLRA